MARQEQHREDILREATALVERAEFQLPAYDDPVVVGYRRDGSASFFFGAEYVFQFNIAKQLRRAYFEGLMVKAEAGKLVSLRRYRGAEETVLQRHDLSADETASMIAQVRRHLKSLAQGLRGGTCTAVRQVPSDANISGRTIDWLAALDEQITIAPRPHVATGRRA